MSMNSDERHILIAVGGTGTTIVRHIANGFRDKRLPENMRIVVVDAHEAPEGGGLPDGQYGMVRTQPIFYGERHRELMRDPNGAMLRDWWPEDIDVARATGEADFSDGCGCHRANGQFFVRQFGHAIEAELRDAIRKLTAQKAGSRGGKVRLVAWVFGSLGNGTGGGASLGVATLATSLLIAEGQEPYVNGVFIPSTVTAPPSNPERTNEYGRKAANGIGALLEIQHELDRPSPRTNRVPGLFYTELTEFGDRVSLQLHHDNRPVTIPTGFAPFKKVYLFGERDKGGHQYDYIQVCDKAADAVRATLTGVDATSRLLDIGVHATHAAFGSMGYASLDTPMAEGIRYAALKARQDASEAPPEMYKDLRQKHPALRKMRLAGLSFEDIRRYNREIGADYDPDTIDGSVNLFVKCVAQVHESHDPNDPLRDQLGERFEQRLKGAVSSAQGAGSSQVASREDVLHLESLIKFEAANLEDRAQQCRLEILGRNPSEYKPARKDVDTPEKAFLHARAHFGAIGSLGQLIAGLVEDGEFALLRAWLDHLVRVVTTCRISFEQNELEQLGEARFNLEEDASYQEALRTLDEKSSSILRRFMRSAIEGAAMQAEAALREVQSGTRRRVSYLEAQKLYEELLVNTERYRSAAESCHRRIGDALFSYRERNDLANLESFLTRGAQERATGLEEAATLAHAVTEAFEEQEGSEEARLFNSTQYLRILNPGDLPAMPLATPTSEGVEPLDLPRYVAQLTQRAVTLATHLAPTYMSLEGGLERRTDVAILDYLANTHALLKVGMHTHHDPAVQAFKRLASLLGGEARVRQLAATGSELDVLHHFWDRERKERRVDAKVLRENDEMRRILENLAVQAISNRIMDVVHRASPMWLERKTNNVNMVNPEGKFFLVTYPPSPGSVLDKAIDRLDRVQRTDGVVRDRIEIVVVEYGLRLEHLYMAFVDPHIQRYQECLLGTSDLGLGYRPHGTRAYMELGHRFLNWLPRMGQKLDPAPVLLALAEWTLPGVDAFGYVEVKGARREWRRDLANPAGGAHIAHKGSQLPGRSASETMRWLDGLDGEARPAGVSGREEAQKVLHALTHALKREFQTLLHGSGLPGDTILGAQGLTEHLNLYLGELRERLRGESDSALRRHRERQVEGLTQLLEDMARNNGMPQELFHL